MIRRSPKLLRSVIPAVVMLALGMGFAHEPARASERLDRLQQDIAAGLASGQDVSSQLEQARALIEPDRSTPRFAPDTFAAEASSALEAMRQTLVSIKDGERSGAVFETLRARYGTWNAAHLLLLMQFEDAEQRIASASSKYRARLQGARQSYLRVVQRIATPSQVIINALPASGALAEAADELSFLVTLNWNLFRVDDAVEQPLPRRANAILRANVLPVRSVPLAARAPVASPIIIPSYADPLATVETSEDLTGTPDAPLSQLIIEKAAELEHDYVRIFEFVRNEILTQWYAGAMKGAEETLAQGAGNDVDQASLLIALYRASGLPARYVHGEVELSSAQVVANLGLTNEDDASRAMTAAGIAHRPVVRGGRVAALGIEATWVSVRVPYTNYRGAVVDSSGKTWIPLLPAFEPVEITASSQVLTTMARAPGDLVDDYLAASAEGTFAEQVREEVDIYLQGVEPVTSFEAQLGTIVPVAQEFGLLPNTLPVPVLAVTGEAAVLADTHRQRIRFVARAGKEESADVVLDRTIAVSELAGRRLTLSYVAASVDDQAVTNSFGGLDLVPAYLVRLRPVLKVGGELFGAGEGAIDTGAHYRFEMHLLSPSGEQRLSSTLTAGGYHAIDVSAQTGAVREREPDSADTEFEAAGLLSRVAQEYHQQWSQAEADFAGLLDVAVIKPLPDVTVVSNAMRVETLLGQPHRVAWEGVTIDVASHVANPLARAGDEAVARDWMRMSALQGSVLEHAVMEEQFLVESISAAKGLQLARDQGIDIVTIDAANVDAELTALTHPDEVEADVRAWVEIGYNVEIPRQSLTVNDWSGLVWRVDDPATGAAGYFISGGLAGGATTRNPTAWALQLLGDLLSSPNRPAPNSDPRAAVSVVKLSGSDGQVGEVDTLLPIPLAVLVRDKDEIPVKGAMVVFKAILGGGDVAGAGDEAIAFTDARGVAQVHFRLGKSTADNPVYLTRTPGDTHLTRASMQRIEADVLVASLSLQSTWTSFTAVAFPQPVSQLERINPPSSNIPATSAIPGRWSDNLILKAADPHGNPIANVSIALAAQPSASQCSPAAANPRNARVFTYESCPAARTLSSCGVPNLTQATLSDGLIAAGVIMGNSTLTDYSIRASVPNSAIAKQDFDYKTLGPCDLGPLLFLELAWPVNPEGESLNAAKPGEALPKPYTARLSVSTADIYVENTNGIWGLHYFPDRVWTPVNGQLALSSLVKSTATTPVLQSLGQYTIAASAAVVGGPGALSGKVTATVVVMEMAINGATGVVTTTNKTVDVAGTYEGFVIEPRVLALEATDVPDGLKTDVIHVNNVGLGRYLNEITYETVPDEYGPLSSELAILRDGAVLGYRVGSPLANSTDARRAGMVEVPRGIAFDPSASYEAQLITSRGTPYEARSDKFPLPIRQPLILQTPGRVSITQDVDVLNERACLKPDTVSFVLAEQARVSLVFALNDDPDNTTVLIDDEVKEAGPVTIEVLPNDLEPGEYTYALTAIATQSTNRQVAYGQGISQHNFRNNLPVGHTIIKGVDTFDGNFSMSAEDLTVPGRGKSLSLRRTYGSNAGGLPGSLGVGWNHNWSSSIIRTRCDETIVLGGAGGGIRFSEDGANGYRPSKGYHGQLTDNRNGTFDFYPKDGSKWHYQDFGRGGYDLVFVQDTNGNTTQLGYDPGSGNVAKLLTVIDASGRSLNFTYEDKSFAILGAPASTPVITRVDGPDGQSISYTYNDRGNLISAERENNARKHQYSYSDAPDEPLVAKHKLISYIDPNEHETRYTYDPETRSFDAVNGSPGSTVSFPYSTVTQVIEPESGTSAFAYDFGNRVTTVTNGRNALTTYEMDQYGAVTRMTDPAGTVVTEWKPGDVLPSKRIDPNGVETTFTYDIHGNLTEEVVDNTHARKMIYAVSGKILNLPTTSEDRNGKVTRFEYDSRGNLTKQTNAEQGVTTYTYASNGDRLSVRDPNDNLTLMTYDKYGNVKAVVDPFGNKISTEWTVRSTPTSITDKLGRASTVTYDTLNRPVRQRNAIGGERRRVYDRVGNVTSETDEENRTTLSVYDEENRRVRITNADGDNSETQYDAASNVIQQTDFRGFATTFVYDLANRVTQQNQPLGRAITYTYDPASNRLTEKDALDRITAFEYDELNRVVKQTNALFDEAITTYDGEGNVLSQTDELGRVTTMEYDGLNRLVKTIERLGDPLERTNTAEYDANSNAIAAVDALGRRRTVAYDALNRPSDVVDALGFRSVTQYDAMNNVTATIDARLNETSHTYDALNRRVSSNDARNFVTEVEYDGVGNVTKITQANGNEVVTTFDVLNRPTEVNDNLGLVNRAQYDADGNATQITDANGNITVTTYDALGQVTQQDLPENRSVISTYDLVGNLKARTNARGFTTTLEYDDLNRPTQTTDALNFITSQTYDAVGNVLTVSDQRNFTTTTVYDVYNRKTLVTDPLSQTMVMAYDAVDNLVSDTDKRGIVSTFVYDLENRPTQTRKDNVLLQRIAYDEVGNAIFRTDANGNRTTLVYDQRNQVVKESHPLAAITDTTYDEMGDSVQVRDPEGRVFTSTYDLRQRMVSQSNGANETTTYRLDGIGNQLSRRRPEGNTWNFEYDGADRLVKIIDPLLHESTYTYDANDNRATQTDARGNVTSFTYDGLDRRIAWTYPAVNLAPPDQHTYGYDQAGNMTSMVDANGRTTSYTFDALNRQSVIVYETNPALDELAQLTNSFDANSNLTQVSETYSGVTGVRVTNRTYDTFDRITDVTEPRGKTLRYTYDANGNRKSVQDPDGAVTQYAYDALNRVDSVSNGNGVTVYRYDRSSLKIRTLYPNGTDAVQTYDAAPRIKTIDNRQGVITLSYYEYTHDANGNRVIQEETNGGAQETTTYTYDATDRLQGVAYPTELTAYTYDATYNRANEVTTRSSDNAVTVNRTYGYNERNQLATLTDNLDANVSVQYTYDANGNRTSQLKGAVATNQTYDTRNHLRTLITGGSTVGQFLYDWQGLRVRRDLEGTITRSVYDDQSVLVETDDTDITQQKYDYGLDQLLSLTSTTEPTQFYLFDALGSVVDQVTQSGTVQARYQYDAWGNYRSTIGSSASPFGFTGHEYDEETGLYYAKARFYDPDTGTFLTEDPFEGTADTPPSLHRYLYAYGNPLYYIDPDGRLAKATTDTLNGIDALSDHEGGDISYDPSLLRLSRALGIDGIKHSRLGPGRPRLSAGAVAALKRFSSSVRNGDNQTIYVREAHDTPEGIAATLNSMFPDGSLGQHVPENFRRQLQQMLERAAAGDFVDLSGALYQRDASIHANSADNNQTRAYARHVQSMADDPGVRSGFGSISAFLGHKNADDIARNVGIAGDDGAPIGQRIAAGVTVALDATLVIPALQSGRLVSLATPLANSRQLARRAASAEQVLFRGTSQGYPGSTGLQRIGITPASTDPVVATLFATESANFGRGVVQITTPSGLRGAAITEGNVLRGIEAEVGVAVRPADFASRASLTLSVRESQAVLRSMGISVPGRIADKAGLGVALKTTPRLSPQQIRDFVRRAADLGVKN